jgi:hypothetical protein
MNSVKVSSTITISIGGKNFELTQTEALDLANRSVLNIKTVSQYPAIDLHGYPYIKNVGTPWPNHINCAVSSDTPKEKMKPYIDGVKTVW